jgi:hypothetical protein
MNTNTSHSLKTLKSFQLFLSLTSLGLNSLCVAPPLSVATLSLRRNSLSSSRSLARSVRGRTFRARLVTPVTTGNQVKKFLSHLPFNFRNFGFGFGFPKVDFLQLVGLFLRLSSTPSPHQFRLFSLPVTATSHHFIFLKLSSRTMLVSSFGVKRGWRKLLDLAWP